MLLTNGDDDAAFQYNIDLNTYKGSTNLIKPKPPKIIAKKKLVDLVVPMKENKVVEKTEQTEPSPPKKVENSKLQLDSDRKDRYSKAMRGHNIAKIKSTEREAHLLTRNPSSESRQKKHILMIGKNINLSPLKNQIVSKTEQISPINQPPKPSKLD